MTERDCFVPVGKELFSHIDVIMSAVLPGLQLRPYDLFGYR